MKKNAIVIGDGITGLILSLLLSRKGISVKIFTKAEPSQENFPIILPIPAQKLMNEVSPEGISTLIKMGAKEVGHSEILQMKFPKTQKISQNDKKFVFLSRNLLMRYLHENISAANIELRRVEIKSLILNQNTVTGLISDEEVSSDYIFDCTGSSGARNFWFKDLNLKTDTLSFRGEEEVISLCFYKSKDRTNLSLRSGKKFRGGVYPLEDELFAVSASTPKRYFDSFVSSDQLINELINELDLKETLSKCTQIGEWNFIKGVNNYSSNFYQLNSIEGFYPVGDGLISSNPVYGRGMSLFYYEILPFLELLNKTQTPSYENVYTSLNIGYSLAHKKWKEVLPRAAGWQNNLLRQFYLPLLDSCPRSYGAFLDFYQMSISPLKLFTELLRNKIKLEKD